MNLTLSIVLIVIFCALGAGVSGIIVKNKVSTKEYQRGVDAGIEQRKQQAESITGSAEKQAERIIEDAEKDADAKRKGALVEAKDEIHKLRTEADKEIKERRAELSRQERRMQQKEENLDKKTDNLEKKEDTLNQKIKSADEKLKEAEAIKKSQMDVLERISEFTKEQAKEYIISKLEDDLIHEKAVKVAAYEQQVKDECQEKARSYISLAIAKVASEQVSETAVSVVPLPNDEMKGRIIGREGRNIRTLETLTGVDLIIDDTPEAITLSC
ncbi:MAG: Rnase Y domain-containing protein, partial [Ruminococcus sp.]|nr:Rnase Y domain-containing protein [Ruminococcus sp.]